MRMVGKQRRRPTGVNKENRPVIVKAFLADAIVTPTKIWLNMLTLV